MRKQYVCICVGPARQLFFHLFCVNTDIAISHSFPYGNHSIGGRKMTFAVDAPLNANKQQKYHSIVQITRQLANRFYPLVILIAELMATEGISPELNGHL